MAQARKRTLSRGPNRRTLYGEKDSFHNCLRRAFARATWRSFPASRREDVDLRDSRSVRFRKAQTQDGRCMRNIIVATAVPAAFIQTARYSRRSSWDRSWSDNVFSVSEGSGKSNPRRLARRWQVSGANPSKWLLTNAQTLRSSERCRSILSDQLSRAASRFHSSF